jgi:hypothetical protein
VKDSDYPTGRAIQGMDPQAHTSRRLMLTLTVLIVIGLAAFLASVTTTATGFTTQSRVAGQTKSAELSSARNNVELLEHRKRQEETQACQSKYVHDLVQALINHQPIDSVQPCQAQNLDVLEAQLQIARRDLAQISPDDPALSSHH